jgi:uncharacterized protein (TIGR04255 family)
MRARPHVNASPAPFELRKAPLVEAWIGFKFGSSGETTGLVQSEVRLFLEQHCPDFGNIEVAIEEKLEVVERTEQGLPRRIFGARRPVRFRARDGHGTRFIQLEHGLLSYHCLCENGGYSGFESLRDQSLAILSAYSGQFNAAAVLQIELHMLDMVDVPKDPAETFRTEDYFNIGASVPDQFGPVSDFLIQLSFAAEAAGNHLQLALAPIASGSADNVYRFRLQWDIVHPCRPLLTDPQQISTVLTAGHEHLLTCFRSVFTTRAWNLFEPIESVRT